MPSIETSIWLALRARVAALTLSPVHPVAWPNESFTKPVEPSGPNKGAPMPYLRVTWSPNINRRLFLRGADPHKRLSLLQVDVFEKVNQNVAVAIEIAGLVAAHFPADLKMTAHGITARVAKAPDVAQPIPDDTHLLVPVTIQIEAFA